MGAKKIIIIAIIGLMPFLQTIAQRRDSIEVSVLKFLKEGEAFSLKRDVQGSLQSYFNALRTAESSKFSWGIAISSERIAALYAQYYRYEESLPYLRRSYQYFRGTDSLLHLASLANSLAWQFIKLKKIDSALVYSVESVKVYRALGEPPIMPYCIALESLGEIFSLSGQHQKAREPLDECLNLGLNAGNEIIVGFASYGQALNEFNQRNYERAWTHIAKCIPAAEKYARGGLLVDVYNLAYRILDSGDRQKEAYSYLKKYQLLKDSLYTQDVEKKAAIINANFEIQRKEGELKMLTQQNEIQQLEIEQQAFIRNVGIGGFFVFVVMAGLIFNRIQSKRKFERQEYERKKDELEQARKMQLSLLPQKPYTGDGFAVYGKMHTATEVGGDYFDFFRLDDHRMLIVFGDATGHGMTAGMIVTITKVVIVNNLDLLKESNDLIPIIRAINESIFSTISRKGIGMAIQLAIIDTRTQTLAITSCGMPLPIIFDRVTGLLTPLEIRQPPLGFLRQHRASMMEVPFTVNNLLILVSDGILERFNINRDEYGMERLASFIQGNQKLPHESFNLLLESMFIDNEAFAGGVSNHDDMTALCAAILPNHTNLLTKT